jgi:hypothetical protein
MNKLIRLQKENQQYELYSILKSRMQPCEVMYFIGTILPQLAEMQLNGGEYSYEDHMFVKLTTYNDIYKKLLKNADAIVKDIDKIPPPIKTGAGRKMRKNNK